MGGAAWPPHGRGRDGVSYRIAEAHLQVLAEYEPIQTAIRDSNAPWDRLRHGLAAQSER